MLLPWATACPVYFNGMLACPAICVLCRVGDFMYVDPSIFDAAASSSSEEEEEEEAESDKEDGKVSSHVGTQCGSASPHTCMPVPLTEQQHLLTMPIARCRTLCPAQSLAHPLN